MGQHGISVVPRVVGTELIFSHFVIMWFGKLGFRQEEMKNTVTNNLIYDIKL